MAINTSPNTNELTYDTYVSAVASLAVTDPADSNFQALIPQMLNYAELRIQRDLDLLPLQYENDSYATTIGSNVLSLSTDDFVTVQSIGVQSGTQTLQLVPVSKEYIQLMWNDSNVQATPVDFAPYGGDQPTAGVTSLNFLLGPYPDAAYPLVIVGTNRAPSLYEFYQTPQEASGVTFISAFLPDLLVLASLIFMAAYQRNFSATSDDPNMAVNYEKQYQTIMNGAKGEELRKRWSASGWTSTASSPAATPVRT